MIKVRSVCIEGYRNIDNVSIELDNQIITLVSLNSYGKSNLMNAIEFSSDFIKADPSDKSILMKGYNIPLNKKNDSKNFKVEYELEINIDNKMYNCLYGYEFEWIKKNGGQRIVGEWLHFKDNDSKKYTKYIDRSDKALYKASETGRCNTLLNINSNELVINKLLLNEDLYYLSVIEEINNINIYVESDMDAKSFYDYKFLMPRDKDDFDLNYINDIPRVIYKLKENYPDKYELLSYSFKQLFPNIEKLLVKEIDVSGYEDLKFLKDDAPYVISNKIYALNVLDKNINQSLSFDMLSDGAKRVFLLLTMVMIADIKNISIIEIEEPENCIHPALLQSFINVLMQLSNNCQIILSSHSPYIIQYVDTRSIYIGKPNNNGLAYFSKIADRKVNSILKDSNDSGSIGNYIFELLSGGKEDIELLLSYLEDDGEKNNNYIICRR